MASVSSSAASMPHPALRLASWGLNREYSSESRSVSPSTAGQLHPAAFQVVSAAQQSAIAEESTRAVWHASPRGATTSLSLHLAGSYVAEAEAALAGERVVCLTMMEFLRLLDATLAKPFLTETNKPAGSAPVSLRRSSDELVPRDSRTALLASGTP